ncbi:THO complex subunit 4-like [Homalodisca vitripennis]|uniref:THO complex subunit 4-like n=1 Tax=Homalodisca vitripennis TaxID=197043 RepID=UPI001EEAAE94|nr:THO complex subunit 4-like [Homalodisca vitripennis]KAG8309140.1 hypothetical protein J6590_092994 [Homalodisca vitripennis]
MSLDDIIKHSEEFQNAARRGRGREVFRQEGATQSNASGDGGPMRSKRNRFNSAARTSYYQPSGDISSRSQHDLYDDGTFNKRRGSGSLSKAGGCTKLIISNLDYGVSNSDIQVLFSDFGSLHSATVNYDKSGRSMGSAYVVFERKSDAVRAMKHYNRVHLDGRPMHIEITTSDIAVVKQQANRVSEVFTHRTSAGRFDHGGIKRSGHSDKRGNEQGAKNSIPTTAELVAELDAYISESN